MTDIERQAKEMRHLFASSERAHGEYHIPPRAAAGGTKVKGRALTRKGAANAEHWHKHLSGIVTLGVVPVSVEGWCRWGAIDIDDYSVSLKELEDTVERLRLPLVICRSKSGGGHLYVFFRDKERAADVRNLLATWAAAIGYPGVEVFPKQDDLSREYEDGSLDMGNWINMPYFDGERTVRYAIRNGSSLDLDGFIATANERRVSLDEARAIDVAATDEWEGCPPCMEKLVSEGFPDGSMNNALISLGVFAKKKFTGWEDKVWEWNEQYLGPGAPEEVKGAIRSLNKRRYTYMCKQPPLAGVCDRRKCLKRRYGISDGIENPGPEYPVTVGTVVKINSDPATWELTIDGETIAMDTETLLVQNRFRVRVADRLNRALPPLKEPRWVAMVDGWLRSAVIHIPPEDTGTYGQLAEHMNTFFDRVNGHTTWESLLNGNPHVEEGRIYFRSRDLHKFLRREGFSIKEHQLYPSIRKIYGAAHVDKLVKNYKGKVFNVWSIPDVPRQNIPSDTPEGELF